MDNPLAVMAGICWVLALLIDVALVAAAFQTSAALGILTLFMPFYAVTTGNHRLRTGFRGRLAIAWWTFVSLALFLSLASNR